MYKKRAFYKSLLREFFLWRLLLNVRFCYTVLFSYMKKMVYIFIKMNNIYHLAQESLRIIPSYRRLLTAFKIDIASSMTGKKKRARPASGPARFDLRTED